MGTNEIVVIGENLILAMIMVIILASLMGSFTAKTLTVIVFTAIFNAVFASFFQSPDQQTLLMMAFIVAVNLGGNLLPVASTHMIKALSLAADSNIQEFSYKWMARACIFFVVGTVIVSLVFLLLYTIFL